MRTRILIAVLGAWGMLSGVALADTCVECHRELADETGDPVAEVEQDIHGRNGLSCRDCHGGDNTLGMEEGDPSLAMDPAKGYLGVPRPRDIPELCGRCHNDAAYMKTFNPGIEVGQEQVYWTSMHGKQLRKGDERVANCASCHGAHGILPPGDPRSSVYPTHVPETCGTCHADPDRMAPYGLPTDQVVEYRQSIHGTALLENKDLAAPACNDCHGNHGAAPPGAESAAFVCGLCHAHQADLFRNGNHGEVFEEAGLPGCVTCHGSHKILRLTDEMLGSGSRSVCAECHEEGSEGLKQAAVMGAALSDLQSRISEADSLLDLAGRMGMDTDAPKYDLREARNSLTLARGLVHEFSAAALEDAAAKGVEKVDVVEVSARGLLRDRTVRRIGLAITSLVVLLLVLAIWIKLREIESRGGKTRA